MIRRAPRTVAVVLLAMLGLAAAQAAAAVSAPATPSRTCLVLPFENRSGDAGLDWMGESFALSLTDALRGGEATVLSPQERAQAQALAGVPSGVAVSHATLIRMADAADAHWLITGWYDYDGDQLRAAAAVVDLSREHLVPVAVQSGALQDLETLQAHLDWAVREQVDPAAVAGAPAPSAAAPLPLPAYENWVRAQLATTPAARLRYLNTAIALAPGDERVIFALGEAYLAFNTRDDDTRALAWLGRVPAAAADYPQAEFSTGLANYRLGRYQNAADAFAALAAQVPLPEVLNNLALARARLHPATASAADAQRTLKADFPLDSFRQLASAVTQFQDAKLDAMAPPQRAQFEVEEGQRLQAAGGLDAAIADYTAALGLLPAASAASNSQAAAAHAGLAEIYLERHETARAAQEAQAALAVAPGDSASAARALAVQRKLEASHEHP